MHVKPLEKNYIESLREWAHGVIDDQVITTPHSAANVALELLDHIKFLQDMFASERAIRTKITKTNEEASRYIAELELIIYHSVRLSDIMVNGHSEKTYKAIQDKFEPE